MLSSKKEHHTPAFHRNSDVVRAIGCCKGCMAERLDSAGAAAMCVTECCEACEINQALIIPFPASASAICCCARASISHCGSNDFTNISNRQQPAVQVKLQRHCCISFHTSQAYFAPLFFSYVPNVPPTYSLLPRHHVDVSGNGPIMDVSSTLRRSIEGFTDGLHPVHDALPVSLQQRCPVAPLELVWVPAQQLCAQPPLPFHLALHMV